MITREENRPGRSMLMGFVCVFGVAFLLCLLVSGIRGFSRPMTSDAFYYLSIAKSLASGEGYVLRDGYWPDKPTLSRSPGWPFAVSLALRVFKPSNPDGAMRLLNIVLHAAGAALTFVLAFRVTGKITSAAIAALIIGAHPVGLYLADEGASEPLFVVLVIAATLLMLWKPVTESAGFLALGTAALVRPNLILFAIFWPAILFLQCFAAAKKGKPCVHDSCAAFAAKIAACIFLFLLPSGIWVLRNYKASGRFPALGSLQGQTFYGANNHLVASTWRYWGYWVFPDSLPGEPSMRALAATKTEMEINDYYMERGMKYIRANFHVLPRLLCGKLVRAYVPIPWKWSMETAFVALFRWVFYTLAAWGVLRLWRTLDAGYRTIFLAHALTNLTSVLIFWGCARFAYPMDPLLSPFVSTVCAKLLLRLRCGCIGKGYA